MATISKDIEQLNSILINEERELYKSSLYHFDKEVLGYSLMTEKPHLELCQFTQRIGKKRNKLILMPRGSYKTSVVTVGYVVWRIVKDPNIRILIDSETQGRSKRFLGEIKRHFENNEKLKKYFGDFKASREEIWSKTEITVSKRTKNMKEPTVGIAGIDTPAVGLHYDVIIADDLHSEKNITTSDMIEQVVEHYRLLYSVLEPEGELIVIGTRWDFKDLYQYIIDNELDRFEMMKREAIGQKGHLLMPERLTREFLDNAKKTMGTYLFSCQYLNEPVDREDADFKMEDFQYYKPEVLENAPLTKYMAVDPAISLRTSADYSAIVIGGFDTMGNLYILDIFRKRVKPKELIDQIFLMAMEYSPRLVGIETVTFQEVLNYSLNEEIRARGIHLPIVPLKRESSESKQQRILSLQPKYQTHSIYHPMNHPHKFDLELELTRFPKGNTDDIIDALSDLLQLAVPHRQRHHYQRSLSRQPIVKSTGW